MATPRNTLDLSHPDRFVRRHIGPDELEIANASLLDEATAAAEAMHMSYALHKNESVNAFFVSDQCFPQTIAVIKTRAAALDIEVLVGDHETFDFSTPVFGAVVQYPARDGQIPDYRPLI